ncbi:beta-ketoacyl-ACP synthase II, partial [bacterium]|nr:beta-ketoacyl-ACP synthase II [bacterium]
MKRRVVVTGLGALTPLGKEVNSSWTALIEGCSAIRRVERWDSSAMATQIAGQISDDWNITEIMDIREARRMDHFVQYAHWASNEAINDSRLLESSYDPNRIGIILGTGIGGIGTFEEQHRKFIEKGVRRVSPFFITMMISDMAPGMLAIKYGFKGINYTVTSACASAGHAIGSAFDAIRYGRADVVLTGGSEAPIVPISFAGFCQNRAMTTRNELGAKASSPFDKDRDGFVMGEGAGILVLEELEHAQARDAKIYCEMAGYSASADAFHITAPPDNGDGAYRVMRQCLEDADMMPEEVGYINAHGTSTPVGDISECKAIERFFGKNCPLVSSTKGAMGHLLGAAAGVEAIIAIKSLIEGKVPPTLHLENVDEGCAGVNHNLKTVQMDLNATMSNSFGFG